MNQNKTVLEKIGISDNILRRWKKEGLTISYPIKKQKKYFKSKDGEVFVESADKYVPPLSARERKIYTKNPKKFKSDFLKNVKFYFRFHTFLFDQSDSIKKLKKKEDKISASLSLLYLFLSAMDHHYYHFDRYLVYEEYPSTPLGYWWAKLKKFYFKAFGEKVSENPPPKFLKTLAGDKKTLGEFKQKLNKKDFKELRKTLKMIKIFEDAQQKEVEIVIGYPSKENLLFKSGLGLWFKTCNLIKKFPDSIKKKGFHEIIELMEGHPITSSREIILPLTLTCFRNEIFSEFKREIKRWI